MYNEKLEALITAALADGVLTEKEKQILFKEAEAMGIDLDEFEMVLDARLVELKKKEARENQQYQLEMEKAKSAQPSAPKSEKYGDVRKCPACGAIVPSMAAKCQECGHEFVNVGANMTTRLLMQKIDEIQSQSALLQNGVNAKDKETAAVETNAARQQVEERTIQAIQNFPIPNTKEDILEFMTLCMSNTNTNLSLNATQMKRTIIYVFGPKRLSSHYISNIELNREDGGWLKIGQTSEDDDNKDKLDSAMERINQESRTGIPEVCQLFDVFEYPELSGKVDDRIRNILTNELYSLECSKVHNQGLNKYEIKAGCEFVYGVTRNQVLNAIAKFERDLILERYGKKGFDEFMELIKHNNSGELPFEPDTEDDSDDAKVNNKETQEAKIAWCNNLWDKVIAKVKDKVQSHINNPLGRPYVSLSSPTHDGFFYDCGYSVRYGIATVTITTYKGEEAKNHMQQFIANNNIISQLPNLILKQGAKNENKWAWLVSDTLDKSEDDLVDWFANTIISFYNAFEK